MAVINVGVVVLGAAGYMAGNFLSALYRCDELERKQRFEHDNSVRLDLAIVADPKLFAEPTLLADLVKNNVPEKAAEILRQTVRARATVRNFFDRPRIPIRDNIVETVGWELQQSDKDNVYRFPYHIIIYDASPAFEHFENLTLLLRNVPAGISYFGEKPIFSDPAQLEDVFRKQPPIYCDFVETANPAVLAIKKFIAAKNLKIDKVKAWRASSSGIKHLIGHEQRGVQGGALLDKSPHDLSITTLLLGPSEIVDFALIPDKTKIHDLIPARERENILFLGRDSELHPSSYFCYDIAGERKDGTREYLPADGYSSCAVQWTLKDGRTVESEYSFGWLGVSHGLERPLEPHPCEIPFIRDLAELGYEPESWRFEEKYQGKRPGTFPSLETQARILIVEAYDEQSTRYKFVANLISAKSDTQHPERSNLCRWAHVYRISDAGPVDKEIIYPVSIEDRKYCEMSYEEQKRSDMAHLIYSVASATVGIDSDSAEFLGPTAVKWVHKVMLSAYDEAVSKLGLSADYSPDGNARSLTMISESERRALTSKPVPDRTKH